jgi:enoyl-CoA hydratase
MHFENLIYEKEGHIVKVTLNRPQKLNALNRDLLYDLRKTLREVEDDDEVRVVVLKGAGRAFCAGHDYSRQEWESGGRELGDLTEAHRVDMTMRVRLYLSVWELPKPVIAQVHGACFAAGSMLAGLCDLVVVAEDAQIGPSQVPSPIGQGIYSPVWLSLIGVRKAKEFMFLGGLMDGTEAAWIGWATRAVPADKLEATVESMAAQIARIPLEMLMIKKRNVNMAMDILGFRQTVLLSGELSIAGHSTDTRKEWGRRMAEKGFKQVIEEWRAGNTYDRSHEA